MGVSSADSFDFLNYEAVYGTLSVGLTAVQVKVGASNLDNRKLVIMQPKDNGIYWGYTNLVTTSNGIQMFKDQIIPMEVGPDISIWVIADGAGKSMRIQELA